MDSKAPSKSSASSASSPPKPTTPLALSALSYSGALIGASALLFPTLLCRTLLIPSSPYTTTFIRIVGIRDLVMAEHLWFASAGARKTEIEKTEVRRHVLASMASASIESVLVGVLFAQGGIGARLALVAGVGSVVTVGMGAVAYRSV